MLWLLDSVTMYVNVTRLGTAGKATRAWFVVDGKGNFLGGAAIVRLIPLPLARGGNASIFRQKEKGNKEERDWFARRREGFILISPRTPRTLREPEKWWYQVHAEFAERVFKRRHPELVSPPVTTFQGRIFNVAVLRP